MLIAIAIIAALGYLFMHWLTFTTDHGHEIAVPNLSKLTEEQVEEKLDEMDLDYVLLIVWIIEAIFRIVLWNKIRHQDYG
jgi:hypothetical protein